MNLARLRELHRLASARIRSVDDERLHRPGTNWKQSDDEARLIVAAVNALPALLDTLVAARALAEYLDDDGLCRVCGETLGECHEECERRHLTERLSALGPPR